MAEGRRGDVGQLHELSERQREVLRLLARGHTNREIADMLGITPDGVKWRVAEILSKLHVATREEAAEAWARGRRRWGFISAGGVALWKIVGVAVVAASVGVLAVAAFAFWPAGDSSPAKSGVDSTVTTTATPTATPAATGTSGPQTAGQALGLPDVGDIDAALFQYGLPTPDPDVPQPLMATDPVDEAVIAKVWAWLTRGTLEGQPISLRLGTFRYSTSAVARALNSPFSKRSIALPPRFRREAGNGNACLRRARWT